MGDALARTGTALLRLLPPNAAHRAALLALKAGLMPSAPPLDDPVLRSRVFGLDFANPVGLAAGLDKDAEAVRALYRLGFGFVEAGTVTPRPQAENPRPNLWRLPADEGLVNALGFPSGGVDRFVANMRRTYEAGPLPGPFGANVGKNRDTAAEDADADYAAGIEACAPIADYLVVNISSPNTPGLRDLQAGARIGALLDAALAARRRAEPDTPPPLLVKFAPDMDETALREAAEACIAAGVDGIILGNTTVDRPATLASPEVPVRGGLSGRPLFPRALVALRVLARAVDGRLPLVGCGGIDGPDAAYAMIRAGASLVQLYSALIWRGPGLVTEIRNGLAERLRRDGFSSVSGAVGADL
jgi:dihydroorotate dehydrogenase